MNTNDKDDSFQVTVDKASFLEMGRVFRKVYRPSGARNIILTLTENRLLIEFAGGGSMLACESKVSLVAEITGKTFSGIIAAHRAEKTPTGTIALTFRPGFGEFATPLAGGKARFS